MSQDRTNPPVARVETVRDTWHGVTLDDPYRWMETDGEEFHRWLDGQARHARAALDALPGGAEPLAGIRELSGGLAQLSRLAMAGDRIFYLLGEPDARVPVLMVREPGGTSRARSTRTPCPARRTTLSTGTCPPLAQSTPTLGPVTAVDPLRGAVAHPELAGDGSQAVPGSLQLVDSGVFGAGAPGEPRRALAGGGWGQRRCRCSFGLPGPIVRRV
ncbi:hypothetical protein GCM10009850_092760 [Nonomuraea monospora]|uniref:Peptidase S9A N-terminal domain-containing protein n=1 Tax=Nonomuraea monospora TaxID=568818 RepID=A0ABN3CX39_9ACTN